MAEQSRKELAQKLQLLLLDVDGVLTDGGIILGNEGFEAKRFDVKDGMGIHRIQNAGIQVGIITGRQSEAVSQRAEELGIEEVHQSVDSKTSLLKKLMKQKNLNAAQLAYMGDDVQDLPILRQVGLSLAPADARPEVRDYCDLVAEKAGGHGAVRDVIEQLMGYRN